MKEKSEIIKRYKNKIENLKKHNNFYFNDDNPKISDAKYDLLKQEISKLEKEFKYLRDLNLMQGIVGSTPTNKFKKVS